jgi:hypothetical protein
MHKTCIFAFWSMFSSFCLCSEAPLDTDKDRISNADEIRVGTNPNKADTDGDGSNDHDEISMGLNPLNANEKVLSIKYESSGFLNVTYIINGKEFKLKTTTALMFMKADSYKEELAHKYAFSKSVADKISEDSRIKAGDAKLDQMEKEVKRLQDIWSENRTQVNEAKWFQAYSEMIKLRSELYPDSIISSGGGGSKIDDLERKVDQLQDSIDDLDR